MGKHSKNVIYRSGVNTGVTGLGLGTGWRVKKPSENSVKCSLIKEPIIFIEPMPRQKIELLMNKYTNKEWLGYLVGHLSELENYFVEDLVIPPHTESFYASAEVEPFHIPDKCIGVIHSHHSMGAFHSGTDDTHVDRNFPVSITVAFGEKGSGLTYDAVSHQTTQCGKETTSKGVVKYVAPTPTFDTEAFLKEAEENVDKGKKPLYTQSHLIPRFDPTALGAQEGYYIIDGKVVTTSEYQRHCREIYQYGD